MCIQSFQTNTLKQYKSSRSMKRSESKSCRKRRITFSAEVVSGIATNKINFRQSCNDANTKSWYNLSELESIKRSIKEQAKKFRILSSKAVSSTATMSSLVLPFRNCGVYKKMKYLVKVQNILNDDNWNNDGESPSNYPSSDKFTPDFRGLENRIFVERQRNKAIAMKTIMEYQRRTQMLIEEAEKDNRSDSDIALMREQFATRLSEICSQLSQWAKDEALAVARFDEEGVYGETNRQHKVNEQAMATLVRDGVGCAKRIQTTSSKRKLSSISNNDESMWVQQQRQGAKRPNLTMEHICV